MTPYESQKHDPPAPLGVFSLHSISDPAFSVDNVVGLLDTGAETTLLPRWAVEQLGLIPKTNPNAKLEWFDGTRTATESVQVWLTFQGGRFRGEYAVADQPVGVIGRNLLNYSRILFDGPARTWKRV